MSIHGIAIVGIDSQFDQFTDIDLVARALYCGENACYQLTSTKASDYSLQHHEDGCHEQLKVNINQVIHDSSYKMLNGTSSPLTIIVINNPVLKSMQGLTVPSHSKSVDIVSDLSEAITLASVHINAGSSVALFGVNLSDSHVHQTNNTLSFDQSFTHYGSTSGYAALLLTSASHVKRDNLTVYANIDGFSSSTVNAGAMKKAVAESKRHIDESNIAFVEATALADKELSDLESSVLIDTYSSKPLTHAMCCVKSITGDSDGFSQLLGLLRTVIALQQRYIPGVNGWQSAKIDQLTKWQSSSFYFPTESRPCYPNIDGSKHSGSYSCLASTSYCHMVLSEPTAKPDVRSNGFLSSSELKLVLLTGNEEADLQAQLSTVLKLAKSHSLKQIAEQQYQHYLTVPLNQYTIALLADSIDALINEASLAQQGITDVFVNLNQRVNNPLEKSVSSHWKTPKGSYFTARPLASIQEGIKADDHSENPVCFMYPGIGATYLGLGRDLFHLFPEIYPEVIKLSDDIGSSLKDTLLNPRSISRLDFIALKQRDLSLRGNLADIAEAGVAFACVFTKTFTQVFKLKAGFATGYSMGEVSMYAGLGCWQQPSVMSTRLANSDTFNKRLSGELLTLRKEWSIPLEVESQVSIWETYAIKATIAEVEAACVGELKVYCTIINTPDSVLIGGYPADCLRVIEKLGVRAMPLNMANAIHSAPAKAEYDNMVSLYTMAVNDRISTKMYSSSCYLPIPQLSKAIANSIAKCLCDRVDFPRLINTLYDNGARIFIEMGPGRSLCSWVDKTLQQSVNSVENRYKPIVSVPVNAKGVSDELTYFRAIAQLVSHGVQLDLHRLFYGSIIVNNPP